MDPKRCTIVYCAFSTTKKKNAFGNGQKLMKTNIVFFSLKSKQKTYTVHIHLYQVFFHFCLKN